MILPQEILDKILELIPMGMRRGYNGKELETLRSKMMYHHRDHGFHYIWTDRYGMEREQITIQGD